MNREEIINKYSKDEFRIFLVNDNNGMILELFNNEGINIIKHSRLKEDRINYILTYSSYKDELLLNNNFLDILLSSDMSYFYATLRYLNNISCKNIIKRCVELNTDNRKIALIFSYFNVKHKLEILDNWSYPKEIIYYILNMDEAYIVQNIIKKFDIDLNNDIIDLSKLFDKIKEANLFLSAKRNMNDMDIKQIEIPSKLITKSLIDKIWNNYDIFKIRTIINNAMYCTDISTLNISIKKKEEALINNYNSLYMLSPFKEMYECFIELKIDEERVIQGLEVDDFYSKRLKYLKFINKFDYIDFDKLNEIFITNETKAIEKYFKKLNDRMLSNYIIDYLFEENYHNIMLDINELLNFYYRSNIVIDQERIEIYQKIANIDLLTVEEKQELFNYLKQYNMMEMFYDDMAMARYIVAESIKEYSLSSDTIKKYWNEEMSKKYGVDVYYMNGDYFFGIVKSGIQKNDLLPVGHSYSLIGSGGLATFDDTRNSNTFLYDSNNMNPKQLVHVFPFDSFTYYHPFEYSTNSTKRVNTLLMADELVKANNSYKEILLLEKGMKETDIDFSIPKLERIALYCLDEIRDEDIEVAKMNNVGIVLINSKKYKEEHDSKYFSHDIYDYNYFDGINDKEKFEAKR